MLKELIKTHSFLPRVRWHFLTLPLPVTLQPNRRDYYQLFQNNRTTTVTCNAQVPYMIFIYFFIYMHLLLFLCMKFCCVWFCCVLYSEFYNLFKRWHNITFLFPILIAILKNEYQMNVTWYKHPRDIIYFIVSSFKMFSLNYSTS